MEGTGCTKWNIGRNQRGDSYMLYIGMSTWSLCLTPSSIAHSIIVLDILFDGSNSRQPLCNLSTAYLNIVHESPPPHIKIYTHHHPWYPFISWNDPLTTNNTKGIEAFQVDAWQCSTCKWGFIIHHALYCRTTLMSHLQHLARLTLFHIHHPLWRLHFYISIFLLWSLEYIYQHKHVVSSKI